MFGRVHTLEGSANQGRENGEGLRLDEEKRTRAVFDRCAAASFSLLTLSTPFPWSKPLPIPHTGTIGSAVA